MARVLITGGSGYLGGALLEHAARAGMEAAATYHSARPAAPAAALIQLDLRDAAAAERAVAELRPALVIHTAYRQDGPDLHAITAEGAAAVARGARAAGARLVHLSSDVIFDGAQAAAYGDDAAPSPVTAYGRAKAEAERRVAAVDPGALIARTSLIYGGREPSKHERLVLEAAAGRADVAFFSDELRCPVQVDDLAAALFELAALDVRGPLNVAGAEVVSRYEFARLVCLAAGGDPAALRSARSAGSGVVRPLNCALDSRRAQALIRTRLRGVRQLLSPPEL